MILKRVFNRWDEALKNEGWGSIFLGNHDFSRMVSRFGNDGKYWRDSATLLASLLFTLRGTVFVYQGDEIGMTNVAYPTINDYNDVETLNSWKEAETNGEDMQEFMKKVHLTSRDNARSPMQWNDKVHAGFSESTPWLPVNTNFTTVNVAAQADDPESILNYYRKIRAFRKKHPVFVYGNYRCLDLDHLKIFAYERWDENESYLVIHNFSDEPHYWDIDMDPRQFDLALSNTSSATSDFQLDPWQSKIFKKR